MTSTAGESEPDLRFPDVWSLLPGNTWLYVIIAVFLLIIWLFFPVIFILGLVILILWLTA